jgi:Tfp pilus assembly protein PilF
LYGDILLQNDKVAEAKASYQKSLAINDQIYEVREQLVRIALGENDLATVIKDGEDALSFFPNQAEMNYLVGLAWLQKKDAKKALSYLKNAVSLELDDKELLSQSYSALGDCYHELQNNKLSDESYDKSLLNNPDNIYTLNNYAYYLATRGENLVKAAAMAKRAVELKPEMASFEDTYAWVLFKQKKYTEAKTWMEKAMLHNKDKSATQAEHYGDILFNMGNADAALQNWIKAKEYGGKSAVLERKINEKKYSE